MSPTPPDASRPARLILTELASPIGGVLLVTDETGAVRALDFEDYAERMRTLLRRHYGDQVVEAGAAPEAITSALSRYFAGELQSIEHLPCRTNGSVFQRRVWAGLTTFPPGATLSYKALAERIGAPAASRAVGLANGANPIAIIVPCHRVIGANGRLTGYGGGLSRKAWLLAHEGARFDGQSAATA